MVPQRASRSDSNLQEVRLAPTTHPVRTTMSAYVPARMRSTVPGQLLPAVRDHALRTVHSRPGCASSWWMRLRAWLCAVYAGNLLLEEAASSGAA